MSNKPNIKVKLGVTWTIFLQEYRSLLLCGKCASPEYLEFRTAFSLQLDKIRLFQHIIVET